MVRHNIILPQELRRALFTSHKLHTCTLSPTARLSPSPRPVSFSGPFPFLPGIVCAALTSGRTHTLGRSHIGFQILGRWGFVKSNVLCQSSMYVEVRWFAHIYPLPRRCPFLLNRDAPKEQSEAISGRASSVLAVCFSTSRFRSSPCVTTDQTL